MCGIAGILDLKRARVRDLRRHLGVMNDLLRHRGPDGDGLWTHASGTVGLAHRRLSIIDLQTGAQPMLAPSGDVISYNGEVYNFIELRDELAAGWTFRTTSDTEVILAAYARWGPECATKLRGMFAFALWDEAKGELFCARDRFGVKPLYYAVVDDRLYLASEAKALLPFLPEVEPDPCALRDYLDLQLCLEGKTLFKGVREVPPGHRLVAKNGDVRVERYWEVYYDLDWHHTGLYFKERLRDLMRDSVRVHLRSDVPVGAYVSGGTDSGIIASMAARAQPGVEMLGFTGKFTYGKGYDESQYARALAEQRGMTLHEVDITAQDFIDDIRKVIYHLDYPVAGPGSFPQYQVSKLAARHRKVVLGGQGGDEIFGGYVRYLIAYFEQCIRGAIDGTMGTGNFVVTYESIIPNLRALQQYKPLLQTFWKEGLFDSIDKRYYRLINRAPTLKDEIRWDALPQDYSTIDAFLRIFRGKNVQKESYFDSMTHFDFKTLLPALLQVEDRMSMAHGLESRVPFLDHPVVEFAATMPANVKFQDGTLKRILLDSLGDELPAEIRERKDKMGFPVPLDEWLQKELKEFARDTFGAQRARSRPFFDTDAILRGLGNEPKFGRKVWGLLSLELWYQTFVDEAPRWRGLLQGAELGAGTA
jgi:asparagine synthase (glutamine-hydrolysing)